MTNPDLSFNFTDRRDTDGSSECLLVEIPADLSATNDLFSALEKGLDLPGYFGRNWNALSDCLRDLHWVEQRVVIIHHQDMPGLDKVDLENYLSVLAQAVEDWKPNEPHKVEVIFPKYAREDILKRFARSLEPPCLPPS